MTTTIMIADALKRIGAGLGSPMDDALQGVIAGNVSQKITGTSVCIIPSLEALQGAAHSGNNLILCDGHPFFLYDPVWSTQASRAEIVLASPMVATKRALIQQSGLCVFRLQTAWRRRFPSASSHALAMRIGFSAIEHRDDHIVCRPPTHDATAMARHLAAHGCGGVRVIGHRSTPSSRIAVVAGMLDASVLAKILCDPTIDGVVAGDAVEWETTPYMEDVVASGRHAALFLIGFDASMAPLGNAIADWVRPLLPDLPVDVVEQADVLRSPI